MVSYKYWNHTLSTTSLNISFEITTVSSFKPNVLDPSMYFSFQDTNLVFDEQGKGKG